MNSKNQFHRMSDDRQNYPYHKVTPDDYFADKKDGIIRENLFSEDADKIAKSFQDGMKNRGSQVRKFYDELLKRKMIIDLAEDKNREFARQLPYIKMVVSKAHYGYNRKPKTVSKNFKSFLEDNINGISNKEEFFVFCDLFEAVVAYSKQYLRDN